MFLELNKRADIQDILAIIRGRVQARNTCHNPSEYGRKYPCNIETGSYNNTPFFNIMRTKKDGEAMNLRLDTTLYGPQLLHGMVKIWLDNEMNTFKIKNVIEHCQLILDNVDYV